MALIYLKPFLFYWGCSQFHRTYWLGFLLRHSLITLTILFINRQWVIFSLMDYILWYLREENFFLSCLSYQDGEPADEQKILTIKNETSRRQQIPFLLNYIYIATISLAFLKLVLFLFKCLGIIQHLLKLVTILSGKLDQFCQPTTSNYGIQIQL